jgi:hypothetical protein
MEDDNINTKYTHKNNIKNVHVISWDNVSTEQNIKINKKDPNYTIDDSKNTLSGKKLKNTLHRESKESTLLFKP